MCWSIKNSEHDIENQSHEFTNPKSNQEMIKILSPCMWCEQSRQKPLTEKGNRKHAFLFCTHKNLSSFREDMNKLINSKLAEFFISISKHMA